MSRPEGVTPTDDTAALVDAAVRQLPEPFRSAVLLCDLGGLTRDKDQRTGEEIDIGEKQPITKYLARIRELGDGPDEPTSAAAMCWASHTWGYPHADESDALFRQFVRRFGGTPLAGEFAKELIAVEGYGANGDRLRMLLQVATDRPSRAALELNLAHMSNPRRGGRRKAEPPTNLALRRDVALLIYDRLAAEYADVDGGKLATTAKAEAAMLRAGKDLPELPAKP